MFLPVGSFFATSKDVKMARLILCSTTKQITDVCSHYLLLITSKVTTPQDAHKRIVLQVFLGSNTLEFSGIGSSGHLHLSPQIAWSPAGILATLGCLAVGDWRIWVL